MIIIKITSIMLMKCAWTLNNTRITAQTKVGSKNQCYVTALLTATLNHLIYYAELVKLNIRRCKNVYIDPNW